MRRLSLNPVTKQIEYIGPCDSSIKSDSNAGSVAVRVGHSGLPVKRESGGLDQRQSDHYIRTAPCSCPVDYHKAMGQAGHISLVFPHNADSHVRRRARGVP